MSVPYRGATFLNASVDVAPPKHSEFPSPIGELHFSIVTCKLANKTFSKFPSPIGELHFSILEKDTMKVVSHSFRPLSGSYISQYIRMMQCFCVTLFPSPIGELHFSIRIVNHLQVQNVFPSPIGELHFSINKNNMPIS